MSTTLKARFAHVAAKLFEIRSVPSKHTDDAGYLKMHPLLVFVIANAGIISGVALGLTAATMKQPILAGLVGALAGADLKITSQLSSGRYYSTSTERVRMNQGFLFHCYDVLRKGRYGTAGLAMIVGLAVGGTAVLEQEKQQEQTALAARKLVSRDTLVTVPAGDFCTPTSRNLERAGTVAVWCGQGPAPLKITR